MAALTYRVVIEPLPPEEGGGFLATVPDLPGCLSDGDTPEQAIETIQDAIAQWIDTARTAGRPIPAPTRSPAVA